MEIRREWWIVLEGVGVHKDDRLLFITALCHNRGGKAVGPYKAQ
jgi:hypothetical protein